MHPYDCVLLAIFLLAKILSQEFSSAVVEMVHIYQSVHPFIFNGGTCKSHTHVVSCKRHTVPMMRLHIIPAVLMKIYAYLLSPKFYVHGNYVGHLGCPVPTGKPPEGG